LKPGKPSGASGSTLIIKGKNLAQFSSVVIGGVQAAITSQTAEAIAVTVPDGAQTIPVTVVGPAAR
jgi:hypothetical protein